MKETLHDYDKVIQAAEQAIKDSDHRAQLFSELFASMDISPEVGELVFGGGAPALTQAAEAELIADVNRSRGKQFTHQEEGEKVRPRRPTLMRGINI